MEARIQQSLLSSISAEDSRDMAPGQVCLFAGFSVYGRCRLPVHYWPEQMGRLVTFEVLPQHRRHWHHRMMFAQRKEGFYDGQPLFWKICYQLAVRWIFFCDTRSSMLLYHHYLFHLLTLSSSHPKLMVFAMEYAVPLWKHAVTFFSS